MLICRQSKEGVYIFIEDRHSVINPDVVKGVATYVGKDMGFVLCGDPKGPLWKTIGVQYEIDDRVFASAVASTINKLIDEGKLTRVGKKP